MIRAALAALGFLLSAALAFGQNPPVPKKDQALYTQIQGQLVQFAAQIPSASAQHTVLRGAAWTAAGCEPVPTLLDEPRRERALRELDALQQAGVQLVTLEVCYPLLSEQFHEPRATLEHYANLANAVRLRGMQLLVRSRALAPTDGSIVARRYYLRLAQATLLPRALRGSEEHRAGAAARLPHAGLRSTARRRRTQAHPARLAQPPAQDNHRSARAAGGLHARTGRGCGASRTASSWSIPSLPSLAWRTSSCA